MSFPTSLLTDPTLGATSFTVIRKTVAPVNGVNTVLSATPTSAIGCIHPATPEELSLLPEEYRHRETVVIRTAAPLALGADAAPDEILWRDCSWRLIRVKDWSALGFFQGWAVRCDDAPEV